VLIVRLAASLLFTLLMLTGLAMLGGRGDNPYEALAGYARYLPGRVVPDDVSCRSFNEYPGSYGNVCTLERVPHCERGYLIARQRVITYTRFTGCQFPAAYLIAEHGRPHRIARYRRVVMLLWEGMSAQVRSTGWFHSLQTVSSVGWWQSNPIS
jgi:hypothetical protein